MYRRYLTLGFYCLVFSSSLLSQKSLSGAVYNENFEALPYALVSIESPDGSYVTALTDEGGLFTISRKEGVENMEVSYMGYETMNQKLNEENDAVELILNSIRVTRNLYYRL